MLISQLPDALKEKALSLQKAEKQKEYKKDSDDLGWAFDWEYEKETDGNNVNVYRRDRWKFWKTVFDAKNPNEIKATPDYI